MRTFVRTITLKSYHWFFELQNKNDTKVTKITKMFHNFRTNFEVLHKSAAFYVQIFKPFLSFQRISNYPQETLRV